MRKIVVLAALAAAACATPETRVRTALVDAGLSQRVAGCMAERMVDRLSLPQLRRLQSLSSLRGTRVEELSVSELLRRVRALKDPEILSVVTSAGIGCAIAA